jgi:hypothetical protein
VAVEEEVAAEERLGLLDKPSQHLMIGSIEAFDPSLHLDEAQLERKRKSQGTCSVACVAHALHGFADTGPGMVVREPLDRGLARSGPSELSPPVAIRHFTPNIATDTINHTTRGKYWKIVQLSR